MTSGNLYELFAAAFRGKQDRTVIINRRICFDHVERRTARYANYFYQEGLQPGDRICVCVKKSLEVLMIYLACLRSGCAFLPLNPSFTEAELDFFLSHARPGMVICQTDRLDEFNRLAGNHSIRSVRTLDPGNEGSFPAATANMKENFRNVDLGESATAALLYSSGTTGTPKGVMISHSNLIENAYALARSWEFSDRDVLLHALPLFHVHGLFISLNCTLLSGGRVIFLERFDVQQVIDSLPESTVFMGVPTYYVRLLQHPAFNTDACRNIRLLASASAPLQRETFRQIEQATGHEPLERYGMTETGVITLNPLHGERRPGSVGLPLQGVEFRLVDDNGNEAGQDQPGELLVRGTSVFAGYWQDAATTVDVFTRDGYFHTGDVATISQDGYVTIVGRKKDLIITGGENVYPGEIESCLDDMPGIIESAVIGLPDTDFGEKVVAVIVTVPDYTITTAELREQLKSRLANYKVPKEIYSIDTLPRNTMGKIQRGILRQRLCVCA